MDQWADITVMGERFVEVCQKYLRKQNIIVMRPSSRVALREAG
jgi:hypothetical protein